MTTLVVTETHDYRASGMIPHVDRIEFMTADGFHIATFGSDQFEPGFGKMSNSVRLVVSDGTFDGALGHLMRVVLSGTTTFSAADWIVDEDDFTFPDHAAFIDAGRVELVGTAGNDTITGSDAQDTIHGGDGIDTLNGGARDDILVGGNLGDALNGGTDSDTASYFNAPASPSGTGVTVVMLNMALNTGHAAGDTYTSIENITGSAFLDLLSGNNSANVLTGLAGDDTLLGQGGDDTLIGGNGEDTLRGHADNDTLNAGGGDDGLFGGDGNDRLFGDGDDFSDPVDNPGNDLLNGGVGADVLDGGEGIDTATYADAVAGVGGVGVTALLLNSGANTGEAAGDTYNLIENMIGSGFDDLLGGSTAANRIEGGAGDDQLLGNSGEDTLLGQAGDDFLDGGNNDDHLDGGDNSDVLEGEAGNDTLIGGLGGDSLIGGADNDDLSGGGGNDVLEGGSGTDTLEGGAQDDTLQGGTGTDTLDGGDGNDTADYSDRTVAVLLALSLSPGGNAVANVGGASEDTVRNIENILGGSADDIFNGDNAANTLNGGSGGDDILTGRGGADTLIGGAAADEFRYLAASEVVAGETVSGGGGTDTLRFSHTGDLNFAPVAVTSIERILFANTTSGAQSDFAASQFGGGISNSVQVIGSAAQNVIDVNLTAPGIFSAAGWTLVNWGAGNDLLFFDGSTGADTITGSALGDFITGGDGQDHIDGGGGNDVFIVDSNDSVFGETLEGGTGIDAIRLASSSATTDLAILSNIEQLDFNDRFDVTAILSGGQIGRAGDITTILSSSLPGDRVQSLVVHGTGSADQSVDLSAVTFVNWGSPGQTITINGSLFADTLIGSSEDDAINGGNGNDIMAGGFGSDVMDGGAGLDTLDFSDSTSRVSVNLATGLGLFGDAQGDTYANFENIIGTNAPQTDFLTGNNLDNIIAGLAGPDEIDGMGGIDTVDLSASASPVNVDLSTGLGSGGHAQGDTYANVENIIGTNSALADFLTGNAGANRIDGLAGDDVLAGLGAADVLLGKAGIDTADYSASAARIDVNLAAARGLGGDAHGDTLSGIENITGTNSALTDFLTGDAGDNRIAGLAGGDQINGLGGIDTADYSASAARVDINLAAARGLGGHAHGDTLAGIENITGTNSALTDFLTGDAGANRIEGLAGGDQINGLGGIDTADYSASAARIDINLAAGRGLGGDAHGDTLSGIENITGTNSAFTDFLTGDAGANRIKGLAGGDQINGLGGIDTADYSASTARIDVNLAAGRGLGGDAHGDTLAGIENIIGTNSALTDFLTGDAGDNRIEGLAGADQINGLGGIDTADYSASAARIDVNLSLGRGLGGDAHGDTLAGIENITGTNRLPGDFLTGNGEANRIDGLAGADQINGLGGNDLLFGGIDGDTFIFQGIFGNDTIGDFEDDLDQILFQGAGALVSSSDIAGSAVYTFASGAQLVVEDITVAQLSDDVAFA